MGPPLCWAFNLSSFLFNHQKSPEYYHIHFTQYKSNIKRGWITRTRLYIQDSDSGIPPLSPALGRPLSHFIPPRSDQESALPPACLRKFLFCILPAPKKEQFAHLMYTCFPFLTRVKKKKSAGKTALIFLFHPLSNVSCFLHSEGPLSSESRFGNMLNESPRVRDDSINLDVSF